MMGNCRASALNLLLLALFSLQSNGSQSSEHDFRISMDVNLVVLGVTVRDHAGRFVSGLQKENFQILENGRPQPIKVFLPEDVPVSVGLIVDSSGSMGPKRAETIRAAVAFMQYSNPEDEMFVVNFNEDVSLGLPESQPFTSEPGELRAALNAGRAAGRTALYDAIAAGLDHLQKRTREKKILVVFSDGGDNASRLGLRETLRLAEESNAIIYTIGLFDERDPDRNPGVLKKFARATGGEVYLSDPTRDIGSICQRIAHEIRNQYTIGYVPQASDGSFRTVKVAAENPDHKKLAVHTRAGYIAPAAQSK